MGGMFPSTQDLVIVVPYQQVGDATTTPGSVSFAPPINTWTFPTPTVLDPSGAPVTVASAVAVTFAGGVTLRTAVVVTVAAANFTTAGEYVCNAAWSDGGTLAGVAVASAQWGGTVDLLVQGAEDAALARKALLNQWVPNSATVPTALTLNDDGGGPLLTRTIGNASATPVSPDQVLRLGKAV